MRLSPCEDHQYSLLIPGSNCQHPPPTQGPKVTLSVTDHDLPDAFGVSKEGLLVEDGRTII